MKKYIAPVAKEISLNEEFNLMATVSGDYADKDGFQQYSNRRSASSVIWGFDDGVVIEDEY